MMLDGQHVYLRKKSANISDPETIASKEQRKKRLKKEAVKEARRLKKEAAKEWLKIKKKLAKEKRASRKLQVKGKGVVEDDDDDEDEAEREKMWELAYIRKKIYEKAELGRRLQRELSGFERKVERRMSHYPTASGSGRMTTFGGPGRVARMTHFGGSGKTVQKKGDPEMKRVVDAMKDKRKKQDKDRKEAKVKKVDAKIPRMKEEVKKKEEKPKIVKEKVKRETRKIEKKEEKKKSSSGKPKRKKKRRRRRKKGKKQVQKWISREEQARLSFIEELRRHFMLPLYCKNWTRVLTILLLLAFIVFSSYEGVYFAHNYYYYWFTTAGISIIFMYLVIEPFKVLFVALITKYKYGFYVEMKYKHIEAEIFVNPFDEDKLSAVQYLREKSRFYYEPRTRQHWRRRHRIQQVFKQISLYLIFGWHLAPGKMRRIEVRNVLATSTVFKDFVFHVVFIVVLYVAIFYQRHPWAYYANRTVKNLAVYGDYAGTMSLNRVMGYEQLFEWLETSLLPSIFMDPMAMPPYDAQHGFLYTPQRDRRDTLDPHYKLVGNLRIRQLRADEIVCRVHERAQQRMSDWLEDRQVCYDELGWHDYDDHSWDIMWQNFDPGDGRLFFVDDPFRFRDRKENKAWPWVGRLFPYGYTGDGYLFNFGNTIYTAQSALSYMDFSHWIDAQTRMLSIEFVLENADADIFTVVKIMLELSATGAYIPSYKIFSTRFLYSSKLSYIGHIFICLEFMALTLILTSEVVARLYKYGLFSCLKEFWSAINLFLAIGALGTTISLIGLLITVGYLVEDLNTAAPYDYINFHDGMLWYQLLEGFSGMTVFFAFIKIEVMLGFMSRFNKTQNVLRDAGAVLGAIMMMYMLFLLSSVILFLLLLGTQIEAFSTFVRSYMELLDSQPKHTHKEIIKGQQENKAFLYHAINVIYISLSYIILDSTTKFLLAYYIHVGKDKLFHNHFYLCEYIKNLGKKHPLYPSPKHFPKPDENNQLLLKGVPSKKIPYVNEVRMQGMKRVFLEQLTKKSYMVDTAEYVIYLLLSGNANRPASDFFRLCGEGIIVMESRLREIKDEIDVECEYENLKARRVRAREDEEFLNS